MSDLDGLIRDLQQVSRVSPESARAILQRTAEPAKEHWRAAAARGGRTAAGYASRITYNTYQLAGGAEGEIGARAGGYGSFGILDDPLGGGVKSTPSRARRDAERFVSDTFDKMGKIVVDRTLRDARL